MWGLETIRQLNREARERAREQGLVPYHLTDEAQLDLMPPFPFPNLGDDCYEVDQRLQRLDSLFCDKSGVGTPDEHALTLDELKERLGELLSENPKGIYLAIEEEGQFQLWLGVWK